MAAHPPDSPAGPAGSRLGADVAAHVEAIVRAAEREALAAERAIADRRRSAEEEVRRYLAAARLQVDAEAAARAARLATLSTAAQRLADELSDAAGALTRELRRDEDDVATALPRAPWPPPEAPAPTPPAPAAPVAASPPAPEATWTRNGHGDEPEPAVTETDTQAPSAARLVAIEMAVGGSSRAEVESHLRDDLGVADPQPLLDDVFGTASHAGSRLAWGEP
jgi:hypothetical protein